MHNTVRSNFKKIALVVAIGLFVSCKEEAKPLAFENHTISKSYEAVIEVSYDIATPDSDISEEINGLIEKEIIKSVGYDDSINIEAALDTFDKEFKDFKSTFPDSEQAWEIAIETEVIYQSESIITIALSTYSDKGGAHGNDAIQLININPKNGKPYSNGEIINLDKAFTDLAKSFFLKENNNESSEEDYFYGEPFKLPKNIGFSDEGIVLLYNVYEIASYDQGYTEFTIPFKDVEPYLKVH